MRHLTLEAALLTGLVLYSCHPKIDAPPPTPRPVLSRPEVIARGIVGIKEINHNWRVVIFTDDGEQFVFHSEHLFYHYHVGEAVRLVRRGDKIVVEHDEDFPK